MSRFRRRVEWENGERKKGLGRGYKEEKTKNEVKEGGSKRDERTQEVET